MRNLLFVLLGLLTVASYAQSKSIIIGDVRDVTTNQPLAYATIGVKGHIEETISNAEGKFQLHIPVSYSNDTLVVTYVGYHRFEKVISQLASVEHIALTEAPTMLDEVRVVHHQVDLRDIDRRMKVIRGNLYAMQAEVTNLEYNMFLNWLEDYNKKELRKKYEFDLSGYGKSIKDYYTRYHQIYPDRRGHRGDTLANYNSHPVVNISHEGAIEYCKWLTERYNEGKGKKKFKKVLFRLPTLKEWQIAALGYDRFKSWELDENTVEVIIPRDSAAKEWTKGKKTTLQVDKTFKFPWYMMYYYRHNPRNQFYCFLGNFRVESVDTPCITRHPGYDGYSMTGPVATYFPNGMGLFDVVGNVAEMIDENGKACGGSWNDWPEDCTIRNVKNYSRPDETVGFRLFMEVIER